MKSKALKDFSDQDRQELRNQFPAEANILIGPHVLGSDKELFFGPTLETDQFITTDETRFPNLLKQLGCFKSTSDAKSNGWNLEIPEGWSSLAIGKAPKLHIFILKLTKPISLPGE